MIRPFFSTSSVASDTTSTSAESVDTVDGRQTAIVIASNDEDLQLCHSTNRHLSNNMQFFWKIHRFPNGAPNALNTSKVLLPT